MIQICPFKFEVSVSTHEAVACDSCHVVHPQQSRIKLYRLDLAQPQRRVLITTITHFK
jgi:hypothetical protein